MTQCERVLKYMEDFGSINLMQDMKDLGVMRLGARIFDMKKAGHKITRRTVTGRNRYGAPVIVEKIETDLREKSWGTSRYMRMYDKAITEGIRSLLKEHIEDLSNRAVKAAAKSIHNKGIKKLLTELNAEMQKEAQE